MNRILIPNGIEAIHAEYKEQIIDEYNGNPFIEALPPIHSSEDVIDKLAIYPKYNEKERMLEKQYRIHLVQRLFQCFQPLMIHLDLESRVSRVIRQGYLARNPFRPEYAEGLQEGHKMIQNMNFELSNNRVFRTTAAGFTIIGVSGMGKTTAINRVLSMYPQIIVHSNYKEISFSMYQLVWLKLDCPFDGSLKGLCTEFFSKVDDLLGTNYHKKFGIGRKTVDNMLSIMAQIARNTGLGLLVIDEIQHLSQAKSGGADKMLNFFVTLVNTIGVPVILIGTTKAVSVLQSEFRQARRGSGQGDMIWERLKKDQSWDLLMNALWDYQWVKENTTLTNEINDVLYEESQGIVDIAVKLYAMSQIRAIMTEREKITANLIKRVVKENLKLVKPMLNALKSGDIREIAKFEDICTVDIDFIGYMDKEKQSADLQMRMEALRRSKRKKEKEVTLSKKEEVILKLLDLNIDTKVAQNVVEKIFKDEGETLEVSEIAIKAIQAISTKNTKSEKNRTADKKNEKDIRVLVDEGRKKNISAYDVLKEKGFIKSYENDFLKVGVM